MQQRPYNRQGPEDPVQAAPQPAGVSPVRGLGDDLRHHDILSFHDAGDAYLQVRCFISFRMLQLIFV